VLLDDSCSWVTVSLSVGSAMVTVYYYLSSVLSKLLWGGLTRLYLSVQIYLYSFIKKRLREKNVIRCLNVVSRIRRFGKVSGTIKSVCYICESVVIYPTESPSL
jgi:hypothetical protein